MIAAINDAWVICTPTKVGTYSLEGTLIDRLNVGYKITPRHRPDVPECVPRTAKRLIVVRHPLDRWASMYWFIVRETGKGIWLEKFSHDINVFCEEWLRRRKEDPHWMWTDSQAEHNDVFQADVFFKQEDDLQRLVDYLGYDIRVSHRNETQGRPSVDETLAALEPKNLQAVLAWATRDCELFKYNLSTRVQMYTTQ